MNICVSRCNLFLIQLVKYQTFCKFIFFYCHHAKGYEGHEGHEGSEEGGTSSPSQEGDESNEVNRVGSQKRWRTLLRARAKFTHMVALRQNVAAD